MKLPGIELSSEWVDAHRRELVWGVIGVAILLPLVFERSIVFILALVLVYALLGFSAVIPIGYTGDIILSQGAFFGTGAYTYVLLANAGMPTWYTIPIAGFVAATVALLLGRPTIRTSGVYLAIATLAFNELFVMILDVFPGIFGGTTGMATPDLRFPEPLEAVLGKTRLYYYLLLAVFVVTLTIFYKLLQWGAGDVPLAVREERTTAETVGIDTRRYRLYSFTLAGAICGIAGGLYAPFNGYISPPVFNLETSINIILIGALGGLTSPIGTLIGAGFVILLPEFLRVATEFRILIYGIALILLFIYLPDGVVGELKRYLR